MTLVYGVYMGYRTQDSSRDRRLLAALEAKGLNSQVNKRDWFFFFKPLKHLATYVLIVQIMIFINIITQFTLTYPVTKSKRGIELNQNIHVEIILNKITRHIATFKRKTL